MLHGHGGQDVYLPCVYICSTLVFGSVRHFLVRDKTPTIDTVMTWPWGQWLMRTKVPVWLLLSKSTVVARIVAAAVGRGESVQAWSPDTIEAGGGS